MTEQDYTVDAINPGDVTTRTTDSYGVVVVKKALAAALADGGAGWGVATQAGAAAGVATQITAGMVPPGVSGLALATPGKVRINTTTGRLERVASFSTGDYPAGYVNAAGWMRILWGHQVQ